ncbi:transporter substrate-binding domain-containing protein [Aureimonas sp. D3]|uniref:transporter substrate-binding domain-containing protein n=1 Tax=Aureimonas sp. D3 TaxID=1638164 RepID=UPI0009ECB8B5|nr:transporter substrate-binding domain-containing protein [Aureimonas sp. D3]
MAIRVKETLFGRVLSVAVVAAALMSGVQAHAASLKEALEQKQVVIGIQGDNPPWGFIDSTGQQQGFDADVAKAFVKSLGVEAKFVPLAIANRIPALTTGKVDVLFSTLVMNAERAKAIQYSVPYAGNDNALVAPKDRPIKSMDDLAGLKVGVPRSSVVDTATTKMAPAGTQILRFDDDAANIQALLSGQVDAVGGNQFYVGRLDNARPGAFEEKLKLQVFFNGAGSRLGEKDWNGALNTFLKGFISTPEYAAIYQKWLHRDAPKFPDAIEGVPFEAP